MILRGWRIVGGLVLLALCVGLVAGCGGSSEAAPLKRSQFIAQADQICATAQKEREALGKEMSDESSESDGSEDPEEVMQKILDPVENMTGELGGLGPPVGQEKEVEAIIEAFEEGSESLEADPGSPDSASAFDKANKLAAEFGLSNCTI